MRAVVMSAIDSGARRLTVTSVSSEGPWPNSTHEIVRLQNQPPCREQNIPAWMFCRSLSGLRLEYTIGASAGAPFCRRATAYVVDREATGSAPVYASRSARHAHAHTNSRASHRDAVIIACVLNIVCLSEVRSAR
jgi:hypothetical protein